MARGDKTSQANETKRKPRSWIGLAQGVDRTIRRIVALASSLPADEGRRPERVKAFVDSSPLFRLASALPADEIAFGKWKEHAVDSRIVFGAVRKNYLPVLVNISLSNLSAGRRSENLGSSPSK